MNLMTIFIYILAIIYFLWAAKKEWHGHRYKHKLLFYSCIIIAMLAIVVLSIADGAIEKSFILDIYNRMIEVFKGGY